MSPVEKEVIKSLENNNDIIVKNADKGGAIVIMNYDYYKIELLSQLSNIDIYGKLTSDPTNKFLRGT